MKLDSNSLHGVIAAIVTPFTDSQELDEEGMKILVDFLVEGRVHGIMTTGGNGEFPNLLPRERMRTLEVVLERTKTHFPVLACVSACGTRESIIYSKHAQDQGASGIILTPPYYFDLQSDSIFQHFNDVAGSVDIPVVAYNNPAYTRHNIDPLLMEKLSNIDGMIGAKQSHADISQLIEMIRLSGEKISVLTGIDSQFYPGLCVGGRGIFSTAASVLPEEMVNLYDSFMKGNQDEAMAIHRRLQPINRFFEYEPGYVAPCKEALAMRGLPGGPVRKPLPGITEVQRSELKAALIQAKIIE